MPINYSAAKTIINGLMAKMKKYRGNWNQNDPSADDYIRNRPFYSETKEIIVSKEQTIDVEALKVYNDLFNIVLKPGQEYIVNFNGEIYKCIARQTYEDEPFIGNSSILGWNDDKDTGEPFFIDVWLGDGNPESTFASNIDGPHTISISTVEEVVKKLDAKYIPQENINSIANSINSHVNNKSNPHDVTCAQIGAASETTLTSHINNKSNPHGVTVSQIGAAQAIHEHDNYVGLVHTVVGLPSGYQWCCICYGNGMYVALGVEGATAYSYTGNTWTIGPRFYNSMPWASITYGDGKFVAVCANSSIGAYSTDGINWTRTTMPAKEYWGSVAYGNGKFVAVTYGYTGIAAYSSDGISWTHSTLPAASEGEWRSVTYGDGKFVAVNNWVGTAPNVAHSTDGITWTAIDDAEIVSSGIVYGNGKFVANGGGMTQANNNAYYSEDGITWTKVTVPSTLLWTCICYGNGIFISSAQNSNEYVYSEDGITWTTATLPDGLKTGYYSSIAHDGTKFVFIDGLGMGATSIDGVNWETEYTYLNQGGHDITEDMQTEILPESILYYTEQTLTEDQKAQARTNIGAGTSDVKSWNELEDKPFDAEPPVTSTEVTLEETTFEGFENGRYLTDIFNLVEGAECTVIWDGAEYTLTCEKDIQDDFPIIIIGNPALADIKNAEDNGQPFCIITLPTCGFTCLFSNDSNATSHTVRIVSNITTQIVYKLDNKYINAEWMAETPIYERVFTLSETTVSATTSLAGLYIGIINAEMPSVKIGSIINFEFDGIKYTSTIIDGIFGNVPLITNSSLPGIPCGGMIQEGSIVFFCKTEGDHVVELTVDEPTYEQLPTEYISDVMEDIQYELSRKAFKSDVLSLYEQTLTDVRKAQTRTNICAVGYDTAQTLTEDEKAQARTNIGAGTPLIKGVDYWTEEDKTEIREYIDQTIYGTIDQAIAASY